MDLKKPKSVTNQCCDSADRILNLSQGQPSVSSSNPGHPRYHVLCNPNFDKMTIINDLPHLGCTEAVTQQLHNTKTAFLNKADQNARLHEILVSTTGREAVRLLNTGAREVLIRAPVNGLRMVQVSDGERLSEQPASSIVLILGHHVVEPEGTYVHVKTFYPTNRTVYGAEIERLH
jgi:hypothetical protein